MRSQGQGSNLGELGDDCTACREGGSKFPYRYPHYKAITINRRASAINATNEKLTRVVSRDYLSNGANRTDPRVCTFFRRILRWFASETERNLQVISGSANTLVVPLS